MVQRLRKRNEELAEEIAGAIAGRVQVESETGAQIGELGRRVSTESREAGILREAIRGLADAVEREAREHEQNVRAKREAYRNTRKKLISAIKLSSAVSTPLVPFPSE